MVINKKQTFIETVENLTTTISKDIYAQTQLLCPIKREKELKKCSGCLIMLSLSRYKEKINLQKNICHMKSRGNILLLILTINIKSGSFFPFKVILQN